MNHLKLLALSVATLCCLSACADTNQDDNAGVLDDENAAFGAVGKADNIFSECELLHVLEFVNSSSTSVELMREIGLNSRAAKNIVANRAGADGVEGTGDDNMVLTLKALDDIKYIGPKTLEVFATHVSDKCEIDLTKRDHIDSSYLNKTPASAWSGRSAPEIEATRTLTGITGRKLNALLNGEDDRGRTGFQRIRRAKVMEAFAFGFPLDEIDWSSDAHELRESLPYTSYTIEPGRFDIDADDGERELSLGTDYMFDRYYDTPNYTLLNEGMQLRGRIRWDNDTEVRRILVAAKFDSDIDANGLKSALKIDQRTEGGRHKDALDADIFRGEASWSSGPFNSVYEIYKRLDERKALPNIGGKEGVLWLVVQANIRSARSRYHLNETSTRDLNRVYSNATTRFAQVKTIAEAALANNGFDAPTTAEVQGVIDKIAAIEEGAIIRDRARAEVEALGLNVDDLKLTGEFGSVRTNSVKEVEAYHALARATRAVYAEVSEEIDAIDRIITGTRGLDHEEFMEMFVDWYKEVHSPDSRRYQTMKPFYDVYVRDGMTPSGTLMSAFAAYAEEQQQAGNDDFEDFEPLTDEILRDIKAHMEFEMLKVGQRQIAAAGTASLSLWFDIARAFYFDGARRTSGNFIIDTLDYTEMVTPDEWNALTPDDKIPSKSIDPKKVFHTTFVNEVQIELTLVNDYLNKMEAMRTSIAGGDASLQTKLDGATFVFDTFKASLPILSDAKSEDILDELEDRGAPDTLQWESAVHSKGKTALLLLSEGVK